MSVLIRAHQQAALERCLASHHAGDITEAARGYGELIVAGISTFEPYQNLAEIYRVQQNFSGALSLIEQALTIAPDSASSHLTRGLILESLNQGDLTESIQCYQTALQLDNHYANAHYALGAALSQCGDNSGAAIHYHQVIKEDPDHALAHFNLGYLNTLSEEFEAAANHYGCACGAQPEFYNAITQYWHMRMKMCDWTDYADMLYSFATLPLAPETHLVGGQPHFSEAISPFTLINIEDDPARNLAAAEGYIQVVARNIHSGIKLTNDTVRSEPGRIRLAFVSGDFCAHATSFLVAELFETIDRTQFDIHLISYGEDDGSSLRKRIVNSGVFFHDVSTCSDYEIANKIASLGVDIALDLNGLTTGSRPDIFAFRPAPVQINYIAYPGTMGAAFIDYIIADNYVIPPDEQVHYSEKIMYLPHCYQVNDRKRPVSRNQPTRESCGLPTDGFVYCSFNSNYKITPDLFSIWMALLNETPGSVLWLLDCNRWVRKNLCREAASHGVDTERIIFSERIPIEEHLARMKNADLFLDTYPCSAHTTASDALWMGLPIVTCVGRSFPSRVAGSLLQGVGLNELITSSLDEYHEFALTLAHSPERLQSLKKRLQYDIESTVLFDTDRYTRHLELGFRHIIDQYTEGAPAATFHIPPTH